MNRQHTSFTGILAIIIASFLWGTTGTVASYSPDTSPLAIGAFSMGIGGLLLVINAHKNLLIDAKLMFNQPIVLLFGAACVAIYPLAFYTSMRLTGVAIGTVVSIATAPFFAAILDRLISKKHITKQWLISFIMGAVGIALLTLGRAKNETLQTSDFSQLIGIILGCIAGLTYAGYSWAARRLIETGAKSQSAMSGLFGLASLVLLPSLWFTGDNLFASATNISVALYMAIIPMFLGYVLFGYGLTFIDASKATLITLIEPLVATILAVSILGEQFNAIGWIGALLVTLCLLMQTLKTKKHQTLNAQNLYS
ncbi:DMT family transporter [Psychrosphaera algicola]|uniref:EamA family transporter n=1 Tax=Psychrosphaera algicola TaxID=3023714 RepID=A0ABT5FAH7_9GAMM|nr:EamA family transporter [Psychrosphaera sp. G1-22]MDC2887632.1 EamA family transporter [Psychrosphaera sp. G1-22]